MLELWRDIPGWEGRYQASPLGHIRSVPRGKRPGVVLRERYHHRKRSDILDARVNLFRDGKCCTQKVGKLVAMTWLSGYEPGKVVNHIDGDPLNNRAKNLEWIQQAENIAHALACGLIKSKSCVLSHAGDAVSYKTMADAGRAIGRGKDYISRCVRRGKMIATSADGSEYIIAMQEGKGHAKGKEEAEPRGAKQAPRRGRHNAADLQSHKIRYDRVDA